MFNINSYDLWIPVCDLDYIDTEVTCPDINSYDLLTLDSDLAQADTKVICPNTLEEKEVEMIDFS